MGSAPNSFSLVMGRLFLITVAHIFSVVSLCPDFFHGHPDSCCPPLLTILGTRGECDVCSCSRGRPTPPHSYRVLAVARQLVHPVYLLLFMTFSLRDMTGDSIFHSIREVLCPAAGIGPRVEQPLGRGQRDTSMTCLIVAPRWW